MGDDDGKDDKDKDGKSKNKLIPFPGGRLDPEEIGAGFVVSSTARVQTGDVVDPIQVREELDRRIAYVKGQELVRVIERGAPTAETINLLLKELAEEISHLKWERRRAAKGGKSTVSHTTARISGLRTLTEILIRRKEASITDKLDIKSPKFQKVFTIWLGFFHESMKKAGVSDEVIHVVFQQMKADMLECEKKIEAAE